MEPWILAASITLGLCVVLVPTLRRRGAERVRELTRRQAPARRLFNVSGAATGPWALLLHGTFCNARSLDLWAAALEDAGVRVWLAEYPYTEDPGENARDLARRVQARCGAGEGPAVCVGYSQGGILLRHMLTMDARPPWLEAVRGLVQVGTPNAGTPVAALEGLAARGSGGAPPFPAFAALRPGSSYLARLRSRALPPGLRVALVTGEGSGAAVLSWVLRGHEHPGPLLRLVGGLYEALLLRGAGPHDGLVPTESVLALLADEPRLRGPAPRRRPVDHVGLLYDRETARLVAELVVALADDDPGHDLRPLA